MILQNICTIGTIIKVTTHITGFTTTHLIDHGLWFIIN